MLESAGAVCEFVTCMCMFVGKDYAHLGSNSGSNNPLHKKLSAAVEADDEIAQISLHNPQTANNDEEDDDEYENRPRLRSANQRNLSMSIASVDGGTGEMFENHANEHKLVSSEVPWKLIFTHPVTLTLFAQAWCFVSPLQFVLSLLY